MKAKRTVAGDVAGYCVIFAGLTVAIVSIIVGLFWWLMLLADAI